MASIDERVVAMSFENGKFEAGVAQSMATLSKLEGALQNVGKTSGLSNITTEANRVSFGGLSGAIDSVGSHFSALTVAAGVALGGIVQKAASAGANFLKSFTLGPVIDGLQEFGTNMNSIQTILANTQSQGTNLDQVNTALQDLNKYSDQTIYNFSQMAKNIGTFTAAGVNLDTATQSIKGIANLAALSGSSAEQASSAMYQLSQAIAAGTVNLQDWKSVENASMGGAVFQKALFDTAKAMGTLTNVPVGQTFEQWKKAGNSFRQSLSAQATASQSTTSVVAKAHKDGAKAVADAEKQAADAVEAASQRVKDAKQGQAEAAKQGAQDIADAVRAQSDTIKQSAADVKGALDGVREARKRLAEAMKPPSADELQAATDALTTSQLDAADLSTAVADAQTEQKRATEDLASAQAKLTATQADPKATASDIQAAQRAVEDAQKRVTDSADAQTRALLQQHAATRDVDQAEKDLATTRQKGTKKDQNVKDAQDALTVATTKYKDAQVKAQQDISAAADKVRDVRIKSADAQVKAGQRLADAEKQQSDAIKDSQSRIAEAHTRAAEQINAARDSINKKPPKSWLTSDVLTSTLKQFTGDMSDAELKAQGFSDAQIKAIQQTAITAKKSATEVKTLGQVFSVAKETMGSGWANTFRIIFGDFNQAKGTFTGLSNAINGFINTNANARNKVLKDWEALGGRKVLIDGLKSAFKDLAAVVKPIKDAFREVFPAQTGKSLFDLTKKFKALMDGLLIGPETADKLRRTFAGFFAVLHIGWTIVKDVAKVIFDLFGIAGKGSGSFLGVTAGIGDFLVKLDHAISKGKGLGDFFKGLTAVLALPLKALEHLGGLIGSLFGADKGPDTKGVSDAMGGLNDALTPLKGTLDLIGRAWDKVTGVFDHIVAAVGPVLAGIGSAISGFTKVLTDAISNADFNTIFAAIQTTLIGGIFLAIKKGLGGGIGVDFGGGMLQKLSKTFEALTGNLKAMQQNVQANTLLQIAAAIGILAAGILILSTIDPKKLNKAMTAVAVGLGELVGAMALLSKFAGGSGFIQMPLLAASMILMATALTILAGAMKIFATMKWEEILKGLAGVAGALVAVGLGTKLMGPQILLVGPGLIAVAIAVGLLAAAMKIFATMKWEDLAKGLLGVAGALTAVSLGMVGMGPELLLVGPGLLITAIALVALAAAVAAFGSMKLETIALGVLGIAAAMVAIGLAMNAMPPTLPLIAAGLLLVAPALAGIAAVVGVLGNMHITTLIKGISAMGAALVVLALGLTAMEISAPGAIALAAAAAALALLVPTLGLLGQMKWSTIFKGLAAIAISLGVLAVAGAIAAPGLVALGVALIPLGVAMVVIAASVYLFAKALQVMGDTGAKSVAATIVALTALAVAMPKIVIDFLKGLVAIADGLVTLLPKIVVALGVILDTVIAFLIAHAKPLGAAITALIGTILTVIQANAGPLIQTGALLLTSLLKGIADNIPMVATQVFAIITGILTSLAGAAPQLIAAGVSALVSFLKGITDHMPQLVTTVVNLIIAFVGAVASQLIKIAAAGADLMTKFLAAVASYEVKIIAAGAKAILSFFSGIASMVPKVIQKGVDIVGSFLDGISKALVKVVNKGADAVINFLNGIADAIRTKGPQLRAAGYNVAGAIIDGIWQGIEELGQKIVDKLGLLIHLLPKAARKILGIESPSTVFAEIGGHVMEGLAVGITSGAGNVNKAIVSSTEDLVNTASKMLTKVPEFLYKMTDINPTITPVLDLSMIQKQAKNIGPMLGGPQMSLQPTLDTESTKAPSGLGFMVAARDAGGSGADQPPVGAGTTVSFVQNNTSPKALSPTEVYRLTNNQLSSAKKTLGVPDSTT